MSKKIAFLYFLCASLLTLSVNAFAVPPEVDRFYFEDDITYPFDCGDFEIAQMGDVWLTLRNFFNKDGELIKETAHYTVQRSVFFNASNPEIYLKANVDTGFAQVTFENGLPVEYRERGAFWHMVLPGGEKLAFIAGLGIYDFATDTYDHRGFLQFVWDENFEPNEELVERMCDYFAD